MLTQQRVTRRQAVSRALAAGGFGVSASLLAPLRANAATAPQSDGQLLYATLAVELLVIAVYERVISSGKLSIDSESLVRRLGSYEHVHARWLARELQRLGVAEPPSLAAASASALDAILVRKQVSESVAKIGSEADALRLLIKVEEVAEGAYYAVIPKLSDPQLLLRAAETMASEAQHRTLLSETLAPGDTQKSVPVAFVQGRG